MSDMKSASQAIAAHWKKAIQLGLDAKKEWQADADECMRFYDGPYTFMYGVKEGNIQRGDFAFVGMGNTPRPQIMMTVNKVAELVQLFGPSLYHNNPFRTVNPTQLPDLPMQLFGDPANPTAQAMLQPMLQSMSQWQTTAKSRAVLMQSILNYLPKATDLETHMRRLVDETLIKGMSVVWTEVYRPVGSNHKIVGSFWDSIDNYVKDPDAENPDDIKWVARRFCKPVWEFEAKFGLPIESMSGNRQSYSMASATSPSQQDETRRKQGRTNDLVVYWQIWSKMGLGGLLREIDPVARQADRFGQFVQIVVTETCDYIVNLPESIWGNEEELYRRAQWETPFWADDAWPCTELYFHEKPRSIWPLSHLKPGLGELKFINWAFSFMASKMYRASKDFIAIPDGIDAEFERAILDGKDYELIKIKIAHGKTIKDIVSFLQHPPFHADFWTVISHVMEMFDKRTGLSELMYGQTAHQYRSAAEADAKQSQMNIRPDDMMKKTEKMAGKVANNEAIAARWHMTGADVAAIFGPVIGNLWDKLVASTDLNEIIHQLQFDVQAGSARRKNKDKDVQDAKDLMQTLFTPLYQHAEATGQVDQINALIKMWGDANDKDVTELLFKLPPPPPPMPAPGGAQNSNGRPSPSGNGKPAPAPVAA